MFRVMLNAPPAAAVIMGHVAQVPVAHLSAVRESTCGAGCRVSVYRVLFVHMPSIVCVVVCIGKSNYPVLSRSLRVIPCPQVATLFIVSRVAYIVLYVLSDIPVLAICRSVSWGAGLVLCGSLMRESAALLAAGKQ